MSAADPVRRAIDLVHLRDRLLAEADAVRARIAEVEAELAALAGGAPVPERPKDPAAVDLGARGGAVGGRARAAALTPERRREIARIGAMARWGRAGR